MSVLLVLFNFFILSNAFNVDIPSFVMHSSPREGSMFGFSVAMYSYRNSSSLLIGAPTFDTNQPGVENGGAVLHCDSGYGGTCNYVPFDISDKQLRTTSVDAINRGDASVFGIKSDSKSNQWFGATVRASKRNDVVVACAPRYVWYSLSLNKRDPVGVCYVARNGLTEFEEFSPCRNEHWGYHRQGYCQAGFDAAITSNGDRLYIGAPGAYYWQGQIHSQEFGGRYQYFATGESLNEEDDNQYLGYSVASGDFNGDGVEDVALGVPKGLNYTGKIAIYSQDLRWIRNITGDQLGSYFGYCLAVVDFNGDGKDDIVVGSPMYTDYSDREMKIEVGRVHLLIQSDRSSFSADVIYTGEVHKARLGLSVTSLGDINLDGFGDIAVGAPYGGVDGRGAVFIYHGFSAEPGYDENLLKPAQVLYAEDVGNGVTTFGWSLSGGVDTDRNEYPDLLVGAYEADRAFLFRSRPIVKFYDFKIEFLSEGKTVDIKSKNCDLPHGSGFTCLDLEFCLAYKGINVDDDIELDLTYTLDTKSTSDVRLLFQSNKERTFTERVRYEKLVKKCRTMQTFVVPGLTDKLTPITAEVSYELVQRRRSTRSLTPVLNLGQQLSVHDSVTIQNDCGPDNVCIPDLILTANAPDEFIIGKKEMMSVDVKVVNQAQDAFEAAVYITQPRGLLFNKFVQPENSTLTLSTSKANGTNYIKVYIGNPLSANQEATFSVMFQQEPDAVESHYEFVITANSTNAEAFGSLENNVIRKTVEAKIDAKVILFGSSDPELVVYNVTHYRFPFRSHEKHIGPSVIHKYGLLNKGPSETDEVDIMILWPSKTLDGNHLLYLMEQPLTVGNVECNYVPDINPLKYTSLNEEARMKLLGVNSLDSFSSSSATYSGYSSQRGYSSSSSQSGSAASGSGGYASGGSAGTSYSSSGESSSSSSGSRTSYSSSGGGSYGSSSQGTGYTSSSSGSDRYGGSSASGGRQYGGSSGRTAYSSSSYDESQQGSSSGSVDLSSTYGSGRLGGGSVYASSSDSSPVSSATREGSYSSSVHREYSSSQDGSQSRGGQGGYRGQESQGGSSQTGYRSSSSGYSSESGQRGYGQSGYGGASNSYGSSSQSGYRTGSDGYGSSSQTGQQGSYESSNQATYHSSSGGQSGQSGYGSSGQGGYSSSNQGSSSGSTGGIQGSGFLQGPGTSGVARTYTLTDSGGTGGSSGAADRSYQSSSRREYSSSSGASGLDGAGSSPNSGDRSYSYNREYSSSSGNSEPGVTGFSSGSGDRSYQSSYNKEHSSSGTYGSNVQGGARQGSFDWDSHRRAYGTGTHSETSGGYTETSETQYSTSDDGTTTRTSTYARKYHSPSSNQLHQPHDEALQQRTKRDAVQDQWYDLTSNCGASSCTRIQCKVKKLKENEDVYIYLRSRLFMQTVSEEDEFKFPTDRVFISTRLVTRTRISAQGVADDIVKVDTKDVRTEIKSAKSLDEAPAVPWWVWLLAILCGILILVILILILYKCGYFRRHRPEHTATLNEDAQPLNSNGRNGSSHQHFYPGDEAL